MNYSNYFSYTHKVTADEIDNLQHVNNVVYLNWVQQASEKHWKSISNPKVDTAFVWIVLRHEIDYIRPAILNDIVTIKTWIGDSYGVKSERFVTISIAEKIIAEAKTIWCLLDRKSLKPARISGEVLQILNSH
jgi:acyl-CoA thioester hydrolase